MKSFLNTLLALTLSVQFSFAQSDTWKTYTSDVGTVEYPADWEVNSSGQAGTKFVILSPQTSPTDLFRENFNLIVQNIAGYDLDLDSYTTLSENQVTEMMPNSKILLSKRLEGKSGIYHKLVYTGSQSGNPLKFEQYYFVVGDTAYVLTFTTEVGLFDKYRETGERILNSFQLK